jgi:hypothetical protein
LKDAQKDNYNRKKVESTGAPSKAKEERLNEKEREFL